MSNSTLTDLLMKVKKLNIGVLVELMSLSHKIPLSEDLSSCQKDAAIEISVEKQACRTPAVTLVAASVT